MVIISRSRIRALALRLSYFAALFAGTIHHGQVGMALHAVPLFLSNATEREVGRLGKASLPDGPCSSVAPFELDSAIARRAFLNSSCFFCLSCSEGSAAVTIGSEPR